MQIPIVSGIYTDSAGDFRVSYPRNLVPVPKDQGISQGYLRPADGIVFQGASPGIGRGGVNWGGVLYRVFGDKLCSVSSEGAVAEIGYVANDGKPVTMTYSFTHLAIVSSERLFLYDGSTLTEVNDPDLGNPLTVVWIQGYFMVTDGEFLIVNDLTDPFSIQTTKYGASEADPDPVVSLLRLRNEVYALNRYTTEVFSNTGGANFPFAAVLGAEIQKGCIGTHACTVFMDAIAFLGSGRNEPPAIWVGSNGGAVKVSTQEIDLILQNYTEVQLADAVLEVRSDKNHEHLFVHLPDQTLVFDGKASATMGRPIWFSLGSSLVGNSMWLCRYMVWAYDKWCVTHPTLSQVGYMTRDASSHWGESIGWEFQTPIIYNQAAGGQIHSLELIALGGRAADGVNPTVWTSYSLDGVTWGRELPMSSGLRGDRSKRMIWHRQGAFRRFRIQKFRGTSASQMSISAIDAAMEPLAW